MSGPYDDIIDMPHHVSTTQPRMTSENRAAQFSPFAALTGYDEAVKETSRLTDKRIELDENVIEKLDAKLNILAGKVADHPEVIITYFRADEKKDGGAYVTAAGRVEKINNYERTIVLISGEIIPIDDILEIDFSKL